MNINNHTSDMSEGEYLGTIDNSYVTELSDFPDGYEAHYVSFASEKKKKKVDNSKRYRCLTVGCNPQLFSEKTAQDHALAKGHKIAKWPVRSAAAQAKAKERNRNGYYDKYRK